MNLPTTLTTKSLFHIFVRVRVDVPVTSFISLHYPPYIALIMIILSSGLGLRTLAFTSPCISSVRAISTSSALLRRRVAINKHFSPILTVFNSDDMHVMEEGFKETEISLKSREETSSVDYSDLPLTGQPFTENSRRVGMVGIKIGMLPQWCKQRGERILCTAIHFPSNEVISVIDPETWYKTNPIGKRKAYTRYGPMFKVTIGAGDLKSVLHVSPFDQMLMRRGINPKQHYGSFLVSEDGIIPPGTHLDVRHFAIGQFVNVSGRTIDWGFQGAMHRWGFRGQPDNRTTKSHRRVGSIGSKGDARVWPGKRMSGHMGHEWRQTSGLEIVRINPLAQVIYVKGSVPGSHGYPLLVNDCLNDEKRVKDPVFPTYVPEETENIDLEKLSIGDLTSKDLYSEKLFQFNSPSIVFTEADEKKSAARDKMRAKIAKIKK